MPKKIVRKSSTKTSVVSSPVEKVQETAAAVAAQPSNNILIVLLILMSLFMFYMFYKLQAIDKKLASGAGAGTGTAAPADSPLTADKLKEYAKDLKLNTGEFNKCLDGGKKKEIATKETGIGSSLGVQGTPGFFINGRFLAGAFPENFFKEIIDKELAGTATENCTDYSADLQKYCSDEQNKSFDPVPKQVDTADMPVRGPKDAKVTIVEFSDFECPFCQRAYPTIKKLENDYKGKIKLVYGQYPLPFHPHADIAAQASLCAKDQGKFWEYHDKLFEITSATAQG